METASIKKIQSSKPIMGNPDVPIMVRESITGAIEINVDEKKTK
tara:strand:- start:479 stop:610 length:132 start_codon:yes stop_codon:yes gene_type:complete